MGILAVTQLVTNEPTQLHQEGEPIAHPRWVSLESMPQKGCRVSPQRHETPPVQQAYAQALALGFDQLLARPPDAAKCAALGAVTESGTIRLPVLNQRMLLDLRRREALVAESGPARSVWAVLAIHYLCAVDVTPDDRAVSFSYFRDCHTYLSVFGKRIVGRFLATSGRTAEQFAQRSEQLGGTRLAGSGVRYRFHVLPRVPIAIARYDGDEEVGPGASVVYQADAERLLPAEDRVVAAELLLDALSNRPMTENGGLHEERT